MIETRKKIIFLGGGVLLLLVIILVVFFLTRQKSAPVVESPVVTSTPNVSTTPVVTPPIVVPNTPPPPPATTEEREKLYVKQLSRTFVERFETSSTQNENRNIVDASELSTDKMSGYIKTKSTTQSSEYSGITTKVISMDVVNFSGEVASVKIGAQVKTTDASGSKTSYKNGTVELKKIDGVWKVDGLFWDLE